MAVTQQLAKLSFEQFKKCKSSIDTADDLVSFSLLPKEDYLDLDWHGVIIKKLMSLNDKELETILTNALDGNHLFCEADLDIDEQPRYLSYDEVGIVSKALNKIDFKKTLDGLPGSLDEINSLLNSEYDTPPSRELLAAWSKLTGFYNDAALNNMYIICWWD